MLATSARMLLSLDYPWTMIYEGLLSMTWEVRTYLTSTGSLAGMALNDVAEKLDFKPNDQVKQNRCSPPKGAQILCHHFPGNGPRIPEEE